MNDYAFRRRSRLLSSDQYTRVFDKADFKRSNAVMTLIASTNQLSQSRVGIIVAKKHYAKAVHRNRIKRFIRESFRQHQHQLSGLDIIVLTRRGILESPFNHRSIQLTKLWTSLAKKHLRSADC